MRSESVHAGTDAVGNHAVRGLSQSDVLGQGERSEVDNRNRVAGFVGDEDVVAGWLLPVA